MQYLKREIVDAVEIHDVGLVHQGNGDGHHDVLQRETRVKLMALRLLRLQIVRSIARALFPVIFTQ